MSSKSEKLLRVNMWISKYLLMAFPFVAGTVIWAYSTPGHGIELHGLIWEIFSWNFMIWFVLLVYFIMSLVFWQTFREKILTTLTFSKERDERESFISGRASKATFYSTLSMLILLFFLSGLHVHINKKPKEEVVDGKHGTITIDYKFEFVNTAKKNVDGDENKKGNFLALDGIPFTQESLLLFLILYHIASYHIFTRRRLGDA